MIELDVKNSITIKGLTAEQKQDIKNSLTIINPKWDMASRMNKALWGIPPKLQYSNEVGTDLVVPVGILTTLKDKFPTAIVHDNRFVSPKKLKLTFKGKLHDYQEDAVTDMLKHENGVLCAKTGSGKTVMMNNMICTLQQPTLILVHTIELANQFRDSLIKFTSLKKSDIGMLGDGKKDIKPITVGLLQTVTTMDPSSCNNFFGAIFVDEVHIAPAETYAEALSKLTAKYKYGASGTPERADGLTKVIFWLTGPLRHIVPDSALTDVIIKPSIVTKETNYYFPLFDTSEYQAMITDLSKDVDRNKLIIDELVNYPTQQIVLLCQRKEQVEKLQSMIPNSVTLTSDMGKKARVAVMKGLVGNMHRVIISTFQLFSTGIDIPTLEVLFICAPIKSVVKVKQSAGRLMRTTKLLPNKQPIIVDFTDKKVELLKYQAYQRQRIYRTL